jgi:uncharacterized membrane protein
MIFLMVAFYVLFPALVIYLCQRYAFVDKIGAVIICYIGGIVIGNLHLLPPDSFKVLDALTTVTIPIALPLLLYSMNIRRWFRLAGKTMVSLGLIIVAVMVMALAGNLLFNGKIDDAWKVSGLMVGVYTGGTPNLAAIKTALSVDPSTYLAIHTADVAVSAVYILFAITIAQKVFLFFLPAFSSPTSRADTDAGEDINNYSGIFKKPVVKGLTNALMLSVLIFAIGGGLTLVLPKSISMAAAILVITTLGIAASTVPRIRKIPMTFQLGQYFILIFCLAVASMAELSRLLDTAPVLLVWVVVMVFGTMALHLLLSIVFKVDADTVLITSVAAICSPPFVPIVAGAIKNKEILVSGLTTGIIGYAIGNYLGVFCAYLFRAMG